MRGKQLLHIFELIHRNDWQINWQIITSQIWSNFTNFGGTVARSKFEIRIRDPFDSPSGDFPHWGHHENEKLAKYPACVWRAELEVKTGCAGPKMGHVSHVSHIVPFKKKRCETSKNAVQQLNGWISGFPHCWPSCQAHFVAMWYTKHTKSGAPRGVHHHFYGDFNLP